jgi:hypothetical protein
MGGGTLDPASARNMAFHVAVSQVNEVNKFVGKLIGE